MEFSYHTTHVSNNLWIKDRISLETPAVRPWNHWYLGQNSQIPSIKKKASCLTTRARSLYAIRAFLNLFKSLLSSLIRVPNLLLLDLETLIVIWHSCCLLSHSWATWICCFLQPSTNARLPLHRLDLSLLDRLVALGCLWCCHISCIIGNQYHHRKGRSITICEWGRYHLLTEGTWVIILASRILSLNVCLIACVFHFITYLWRLYLQARCRRIPTPSKYVV